VAKNPDHYAIVIGIDTYPQLRPLRAAVRDAARFAEWLQSSDGGGLPPENVKLILSPPGTANQPLNASPVGRQVDLALQAMGIRAKKPIGARLYFYFAGHGFGPSFDDVGMLWADAAEDYLSSNIGLRPCRVFFKDFRFFDEVLFILDCCRDPMGGIQPNGFGFTFARNETVAGSAVTDFVLMGAAYGEKAFQAVSTVTGERRGLLTEAVLNALEGNAPAAVDVRGRVTTASLAQYVGPRVQELAKQSKTPDDQKLAQNPQVFPPDREIVLVTFSQQLLQQKGFMVPVRITAPAGFGGDVILRTGSTDRAVLAQRPAMEVTPDQPPWEVPLLRDSRYELEHTGRGLTMILDTTGKTDPFVFALP
jgi:hypothetical protein